MIDELRKEFDLSDVERFGELTSIAHKLPSPFRLGEFTDTLLSELRNLNYRPKQDFILVVGRSFNLSVVSAKLARTFGHGFKILVWSATEAHYVERIL